MKIWTIQETKYLCYGMIGAIVYHFVNSWFIV